MHVAIDDKKKHLKLPLKKQEADEDLYRGTRVVREEALGERVTEYLSRLNLRFAERLGVCPTKIKARHHMLVEGTMVGSVMPVAA